MSDFNHITVLLNETVDYLDIKPDGKYVDCTLGGAGHSEYLLSQLNENGHLYCFDQDLNAINNAKLRLKEYIDQGMVTFIHSNFINIKEELNKLQVFKVDGILYDLGVSSPQLDEKNRGFSYQQDAKLDMRMNQTQKLTAYDVVNTYSYQDLVKIFYKYGEEKFSKQIARKIESARQEKTIETTYELVELIKEGIPAAARRKGGHPAKRIFQAIRIEVNNELNSIETSVTDAIDLLEVGGRISVITFHSLEDRIVKHIFKEQSTVSNDLPRGLPVIPVEMQPKLKLITKKPIIPSEQEILNNRRARSSKLRVVECVK